VIVGLTMNLFRYLASWEICICMKRKGEGKKKEREIKKIPSVKLILRVSMRRRFAASR